MENNSHIENDEVTLKDLILKIQDYFKEIIQNWILLILIPLPLILYMVYGDYQTPKTYTSELTFMMNEDDGNGLGALGGLAASFGFGSGRGGEYNLDKMHSLLKSRNIIQQSLFEKVQLNELSDFYANHLIREYDLHKAWEKDVLLKDFLFTDIEVENFDRKENKALKSLYGLMIGSSKKPGLLSSKIDDDTGIMKMNLESTDEELSIKLVESLYDKLSSFYIDKTIEKQKRTYQITKNKVDSLKAIMDSAQLRLLKMKDSQRNLSLRQYEAEELKLERKSQVALLAYGEALKNQEIADFTLKSKTPFIQVIDLPIPPLSPNKTIINYIKSTILGGIIGGFLAVVFIVGRRLYRDTMEGE